MLQQNGLDVRVPGKNMHEFSPAIAAEPDDADRDHLIKYSP
jgi:hypothetical protein